MAWLLHQQRVSLCWDCMLEVEINLISDNLVLTYACRVIYWGDGFVLVRDRDFDLTNAFRVRSPLLNFAVLLSSTALLILVL
jgi:hypothetical protein